jgi:hypothetical protein
MAWREKGLEWLRRYGVAEVVGVGTALAASVSVRAATGNDVLAAYGGALGENVGYYGVIVARDIGRARRAARAAARTYGSAGVFRTARDLILEFGVAEVIDTAFVRPLAMALGMRFVGPGAGVVAGKLVADVAFYVPVICAYELRRRFQRAPASD